jgi:hypothetical protein
VHLRTIVVGITLAAMLTACSSSPAGSTPPGATATPQATATATATATAIGGSQLPLPSFGGDPELAAKFPTQVAGQPVTDLLTVVFIDFIRGFGTTEAQLSSTRQAFNALGIDLDKVVYGSADALVNGNPVSFQAFRVPGQDAAKLMKNYALLSSDNEGDTLESASSGGKSVSVIKSAGVASTWMYASGDTLWSVNTSDPDEAAAVFAALP